ncbi:MAG: bifunctional ornithine acetyltransferase/N-acetylglutamate synthase, partial [Rhodobacteraceae bacterium]|nr:bifunctional ornithine acetyltransferase/N-acetylglutamate synthase [Paracoccaceae bacterium]
RDDEAYAILVNSGNANAFTGEKGHQAVKHVMKALSGALSLSLTSVLMASTGVIGEFLPYKKIVNSLPKLIDGLSINKIEDCSRAIMTTDTYPKYCSKKISLDNQVITIVGIAKGSGMIAPNMGTMLSFIITDAKVSQKILRQITKKTNDTTFNSISVDSDTSTSDTVLVAATSKVNMSTIEKESDPRIKTFTVALESLMKDLALEIVRDGEGASKLVEYEVIGAVSNKSAKTVAFSIANSPLVKTAIAGEDPNWGRIIMAIGKSGEKIQQETIVIYIGENLIVENGKVANDYNEENTQKYMRSNEIYFKVDLGLGIGQAKVWGCDFTKEYISINADYRS